MMISAAFLKKHIQPRRLGARPIPSDKSLLSAIKEASASGIHYLTVMEKERPVGIIPLIETLSAVESLGTLTVKEFMCTDFSIAGLGQIDFHIYEAPTVQYVIVENAGEYLGVIDLADADRYYDTLLGDIADMISQLLDSAHNGIIAFDKMRNVIVFTQKAAEIYGVDSSRVIDRALAEALPESSLNQFMFESGAMVDHQCMINGYSILANRTPLILNDEIIGGISVFQDVTQNELTARELRSAKENETYLENIIENSYDGIYITDRNGLTLKVNKSYERITGVLKEKLLGRYVQELVRDGLMSCYITDQVVNEKKPVTINQTVNNNQGLIITGSPIFDQQENVSKVVTSVRDISELITLQKKLSISEKMAEIYRNELFSDVSKSNVVCTSDSFKQVLHIAKKVAAKSSTVLLRGETGVGKEIVAKYIHANSQRSKNNYIKINCGAIPPTLLESELFGYVGGAFTGANPKGKLGMFELANEGTLFLDEIGELPYELQSTLLRVLQDGIVTRVGGEKEYPVDVRIIAATNQNLEEMIQKSLFRSDLYYRLNVVPIFIPSLRERPEDIPGLAENFINELNKKYDEHKILTSNFIDKLIEQEWPGNARELRNFIEKQFVISDADIMDTFVLGSMLSSDKSGEQKIIVNGLIPMSDAIKTVESILVNRAMKKYHNTHKAAKALNMSQATFFRKYKEHCVGKSDDEDIGQDGPE